MKTTQLLIAFLMTACAGITAQAQTEPHLHVSKQWDDCSFQLDSSLTQDAWQQFTLEAGQAAYFRPLMDARPMGKGQLAISVIQWKTAINESDDAWNNTFVHPDSTHWLVGGPRLPIPALTARMGLTNKLDLGIFWIKNPTANYSITGAQMQYALFNDTTQGWAASSRLSFSTVYGPKDLTLSSYGIEMYGSKKFNLVGNWLSINPYAGFNCMLTHSHERTPVVNLNNENRFSLQGTLGLVAKISVVQIAIEYSTGQTNTWSYRFGCQFGLYGRKKQKGLI